MIFNDITLNTLIYWIDEEKDWGELIIHKSLPIKIEVCDYDESFLNIYVLNDTKEQNCYKKEEDKLYLIEVPREKNIETINIEESFLGVALRFKDLKKAWKEEYVNRYKDLIEKIKTINNYDSF